MGLSEWLRANFGSAETIEPAPPPRLVSITDPIVSPVDHWQAWHPNQSLPHVRERPSVFSRKPNPECMPTP